MVEHINDDNFISKVLQEEGLVIVDFSAKWCGPCRMLSPILENISEENEYVKVTKIDVDESPIVSRKYNIQSIPMLLFFKNGKIVDEIVGFVPKDIISIVIDENL
ncbi:MAG: thioredoxin [Clostridium sp.]